MAAITPATQKLLREMYLQMGIPNDMVSSLIRPGMDEAVANRMFREVQQQAKLGVPPYNMKVAGQNLADNTATSNALAETNQEIRNRKNAMQVSKAQGASGYGDRMYDAYNPGPAPTSLAQARVNQANAIAAQQVAQGKYSTPAQTSYPNQEIMSLAQQSQQPAPVSPVTPPVTVPNMAPSQAGYGLPDGSLQGQEIYGSYSPNVNTAVKNAVTDKVVVPKSNYGKQYAASTPSVATVNTTPAPPVPNITYDMYKNRMETEMGYTPALSEYQGSLADGTLNTAMNAVASPAQKSLANGGGGSGLDWGMKGIGGTLLGGAQIGLGLLSYFDQKKTAKKQRALMDQQLAHNKYALDHKKKSDAAWAMTQF